MSQQPIRILLIEDDEEDYMITGDVLEDIPNRKYQLTWVSNFEEAIPLIQQQVHDVYLLDYRLGRDDGLSLLKEINAKERKQPFILLTGQDDIELDTEAMAAGASDFLVKGEMTSILLERTIRYAIQKKKEEAVLEEEKKMAQMYLDIAGSMILVLDTNGQITLLNQSGEEIVGVQEKEVVGQNWFDSFIPQPIREEVRLVFKNLLDNKVANIEYYENAILTKSGAEKLIWWHNRVLFKDSKPIGTISSGVDITEQRKKEEQLIDSESSAQTLFEYSPIMIWEEDYSSVKKALNYLKETGVTDFRSYYKTHPKELIHLAHQMKVKKANKKTLTFFDASTLNELEENLANWSLGKSIAIFLNEIVALAEGKTSFETEFPIQTAKGEDKYIQFQLVIPPAYQDTFEKVIISSFDITAQKEAVKILAINNQALEEKVRIRTAALEDNQFKFIEAQAIAQIGHWEWNLKKDKMVFSKGMYDIFDLSKNTPLTPKHMLQFIHEDDREMEQEKLEKTIAEKKGYVVNHRIVTSKDHLKYVRSSVQILELDSEGNVERLFGVLKDITPEKEAAVQLEIALEKERELNELKSRFVSMASHEFRTPLSSILSSAELLEMYLESGRHEKCEKNINRIKKSVRNLTGILNDFLSLEKLESGKVSVQYSKISIKEYVEELSEEIEPLLKEGQQLESNYPTGATLTIDTHLLTNILINLISNAIKYSPDGADVALSFSLKTDHWLVEVIDQGIGIPEEDKVHMFSRFFRATNVENIQGTGLGLTIVKRYLDLIGGTIGFDSEFGKGSTFYFTLPTN